jgi:hypothetical protein
MRRRCHREYRHTGRKLYSHEAVNDRLRDKVVLGDSPTNDETSGNDRIVGARSGEDLSMESMGPHRSRSGHQNPGLSSLVPG